MNGIMNRFSLDFIIKQTMDSLVHQALKLTIICLLFFVEMFNSFATIESNDATADAVDSKKKFFTFFSAILRLFNILRGLSKV